MSSGAPAGITVHAPLITPVVLLLKWHEHHLIRILRDSIVNTLSWLLDEILSLLSHGW